MVMVKELVKFDEQSNHAKFDIDHTYSFWETCSVKLFATPGWMAGPTV